MVTFDSRNLTALSESHPRTSKIDTLQIHHAATTSFAGARALMDPGGRQVSSNGLLRQDGHLQEVVAQNRRAFTSGVPSQDQRSLTVETVNTSGAPNWGISDAEHERLAQLAAEMHREFGMPIRRGQPGILQHKEVPGTYATACAGPSMDLDRIVARAQQIVLGAPRKESLMYLAFLPNGLGVLVGPSGKAIGFPDRREYLLVKSVLYGELNADETPKSPYRPPVLSETDLTLVRSKYLQAVSPDPIANLNPIIAATRQAVVDAIRDTPIDDSLAETIISGVEARLQDDFAAVNANIDDQPTQFNVSPKE